MTSDHRRLSRALLVCTVATLGEVAGGALTRSLALTADGLHSLVHVGALLVALWGGTRRAPGEADEAAAINALVILALAVLLALEGVSRLAAPEPVAWGPALTVTALGLLANILTVLALGRGRHGDLNHRAALAHMLGDAGVAVIALVGLGAGALFAWPWGDALAGLAGAAVLAALGARLLLQTLAGEPSGREDRPAT